MEHRRLQILFALIALFAFGVIVWYFLFSKPESAPTLQTPTSAFSLRDLPARFAFIFQGDEPGTNTETEITPASAIPFNRIWGAPATGNVFVSRPILREVTSTSTVGTTTISTTKTVRATTTVLMFVDRVTGYVYGHVVESGTTYQISNTTIPGVFDAYIWAGGDRIVMRSLGADRKTIVSILASIPNVQEGRDPEPLIDTTYLPQNISSTAVSKNLSTVSYVVPGSNGSTIYSLSLRGTARVADSPFSEWTLSYGGEQLYATSHASAYVEGATVALPSFSSVVGGKTGLLSTPSSNGPMLNSMWSQSGLATFGVSVGKIASFTTKTLASKCVGTVSPYFVCGIPQSIPESVEGLPDDWYQGRFMFDDTLSIVNAQNGETYTLYSFPETYGQIDVTHLTASAGSDLISFIRRQDGSLFLLNTNLFADESE